MTIASDAVIICNEEGRILGLSDNCRVCGVDFVGTVLIVGTKGDEFCDVPEADFLMDLWGDIFPVYNPDGSYNYQGNGYLRIGTDYQINEV